MGGPALARVLPPLAAATALSTLGWVVWLHLASYGDNSVTLIYWHASRDFLSGRPLYTGVQGYSYWPQSAAITLPFTMISWPLNDFLWRALGVVLLGAGLWRVLPRDPAAIALAVLVLQPGLFSVLLNGQAEPHMLGLLLLGVAAADRARPWWAGAALALAFWVKPIALVPLLLLFALRPALRLPLAAWTLGLGLLLASAAGDPLYGIAAFWEGVQHIAAGADPVEGRWSDVGGLLAALGLPLAGNDSLLPRAALALAALAMAAWMLPRWPQDQRALRLLWLGLLWLVLFNPRTESGSYALLACYLAWLAAEAWKGRRGGEAGFLLLLGALLGVENYGDPLLRATDLWFKPALTLLVLPYLLWRLAAPPAGEPRPRPA